MPWPDENLCVRGVDWSWFQNDGSDLHRPFDVDAFCIAHPDIELAIIRAVWPNGVTDPHYVHYFDGFTRNGKRVAAYLWPNPQKTIPAMFADWKRALGDRVPKLLAYDYEEATTFIGKTSSQLTVLMRSVWEAAPQNFPSQVHMNYSRGSWLNARIIQGTWINDMRWWLAHYIYPKPDVALQAKSFAEIDALLPIGNSFTPYRGNMILQEQVIGWQISSKGQIVPNGTSDMDYLLKSFVASVYGVEVPPPSPSLTLEQRVDILDREAALRGWNLAP